MTEILLFAGGVVFGALVVLIVHVLRKKDSREIARALVSETEAEKVQDLEALMGRVRDSFGALSQDALKASTDELLKLARENLDGRVHLGEKDLETKKQLIDQNLATMKGDIHKMQELVSRFEKRAGPPIRGAGRPAEDRSPGDVAPPGHGRPPPPGPGQHQGPRPVGRADGRGRPAAGRLHRRRQLHQTDGPRRPPHGRTTPSGCRRA